jgi:putative thioredoxin
VSDSIPRGAVDLGALAAKREAQTKAASAPPGLIIEVTTANFQSDVIERSMTVPVVLDLWASWCEPCKTLSPILESLAIDDAGKWILAKVDVDAEPQISQAFQVQSIPSVFALIKGQPLPLFQGALPKEQIRQYLDALLAEAAKNGVTGGVPGEPEPALEATSEPKMGSEVDPEVEAAYDAMANADWDAAETAFRALIAKDPTDIQAKVGLGSASLYRRVDGLDPIVIVESADKNLDDIAQQCQAADLEAVNGQLNAAFTRLIAALRRSAGDDKAAARERLLELFEVAGPDHPDVPKARVELANALF